MKLKRFTALVICIVLLISLLAGCGSKNEDCSFPDCGPDSPPHIDFNAAISAFSPDTVMLKAGNSSFTWAELYVILFNTVLNLSGSYGPEIPWDEVMEGATLAELVMEYTISEAMTFLTYMYGIESSGFVPTEHDLAELREDLDSYIQEMGGKEALEEYLRENSGIYNFEVFEKLLTVEFTVGLIADQMFGIDGSDFSDESVIEYAESRGFELLMAMHILRLKSDDDTPLKEAEEILARLQAQVGSADFVTRFNDEMFEHTEDMGGLMSFPNGYLFVPDAMVEAFSEATMNLRIGEMSGIVETEYGYHIILRIPVDYDTPLMTRGGTSPGTFRQQAAAGNFEALIDSWFESVDQNVEFTKEFDSIDLRKIFVFHG